MQLPKVLTTVTPFSKYLAIVLFILFPILSFYLGMKYQESLNMYPQQRQTVCTQEAKLCPDGTYVGRQGPNCDFALCPQQENIRQLSPTPIVTGWKIYTNQDYSVQYPQDYIVHEESFPSNTPVNYVTFRFKNDQFGQTMIEREDQKKIPPSNDTTDYIKRTLAYYDSTLRRIEPKQLGKNTVYFVTLNEQLRDDIPQGAFIRSGDTLFRFGLQTGGGGYYAASQISTYDDFIKIITSFTLSNQQTLP